MSQSGSVLLEVDGQNGKEFIHLQGVLYLPGLNVNLLSLQKLTKKNVFPFYQEVDGKAVLRRQIDGVKREQIALMTVDGNGRATLDCKVMKGEYGKGDMMQISIERFHERMGHAGQGAIDKMIRNELVTGISGIKAGEIGNCNICKLGKLPRQTFAKVSRDPSIHRPLDMIFVDLAGPNKPATLGGARYDMVIIDAFTRRTWVILLAKKSDSAEKLAGWLPKVKKAEWKQIEDCADGQRWRVHVKQHSELVPVAWD